MGTNNELPLDQIICGDCIQVLTSLPSKSVDMIFADPPYNLQLEKQLWRPNSTRVSAVDEKWDQFPDFKSYDLFTHAWLSGCQKVLKDSGTIWVIGSYHNIFRVGKIMQDMGYWILNDIVWIKNNPMPNFHGVRFTNAHETLIWAQKRKGNKYTFNYRIMKSLNINANSNGGLQMRSDWKLPLCTGKERLKINGERAHPTQKPEALLERVLMASTNPGDVVLDPFFGSGTTGAVAKRFGRHWIGIELEQSYIKLANQRIDGVTVFPGIVEKQRKEAEKKNIRIPFISLLNAGYIKDGQTLFFNNQESQQAIVLHDGSIRCGEFSGSIHKVGRSILHGPCNGWLAWYYIDQVTGKHERLDVLRQRAREDLVGNNQSSSMRDSE